MKTFDETLMEADRIVKRLGNIANRPDIRLAQTMQLIELLYLVYRDFTDKDVVFRHKLKYFILDNKTAEMNRLMRSSYSNTFIAEVDAILAAMAQDET